jgi:hypothetical protein
MIPVFSGRNAPPEEKQKAQEVKRRIEEVSDQSSRVLVQSLGADFSTFDGAVVIGGQNTNAVYNQLITLREFEAVTPENDDVARVQDVDKTPVLVMAGYTDEDTVNIIERELSSGIVSEFIDELDEEPTEEIPEPGDPVTPLPPPDDEPEPEPPETPQELIVRPPQKFDIIVNVDYRIEFSGVVREKSDMERGDHAVNHTAVGSVGASLGVDQDVFEFSGKIENVEAEQDMVMIINDEEYIFDSGANKIKKAQDFLGDIGGREEVDHIAKDMRKESLERGQDQGDDSVIGGLASSTLLVAVGIFLAVYFLTRGSPEVVVRD